MEKKKLIISIIIVLVLAGGIGVYYYGYKIGYKNGYDKGLEVGGAAAKVGAGEAVSNPMENMPSTNPLEGVVNPFEEGYQNPFK